MGLAGGVDRLLPRPPRRSARRYETRRAVHDARPWACHDGARPGNVTTRSRSTETDRNSFADVDHDHGAEPSRTPRAHRNSAGPLPHTASAREYAPARPRARRPSRSVLPERRRSVASRRDRRRRRMVLSVRSLVPISRHAGRSRGRVRHRRHRQRRHRLHLAGSMGVRRRARLGPHRLRHSAGPRWLARRTRHRHAPPAARASTKAKAQTGDQSHRRPRRRGGGVAVVRSAEK
jgi:hypothetical protein